ncbi:DinB family protein [candidate division KSB1 bacterium]
MEFNFEHCIDILSRTPDVIGELLSDIPGEWADSNEGEGTWSPYENVAHFIHGEHEDWLPRLKIILEHGDKNPFTPFDPQAFPSFCEGKTLSELLDEFEKLRLENIEELRKLNLKEEDFQKTGAHPEFGPVSIQQLIATWAVHDLSHIAQIARVMAKQFTEETGPWAAYLPILTK